LLKNETRIRVVESEEALTPAAFRNHVFKSVRGQWIFFIDDDARVHPKIFRRFLLALERRPGVAIFGGPNINPPESSLFQRSSGFTLASRFATSFSSVRYEVRGGERLCDETSLTLCNLFVRTDALEPAPFPPNFVCCEENWLLQNLQSRGWKAVYDPTLAVWHERRPDLPSLMRQIFRYGFGRGQIFKRRRFGIHAAHLIPTFSVAYAAMVTGAWISRGEFELIWATPVFAYAALCAGAAIHQKIVKRRSVAEVALSTGLFPVVHASYGIGLFWGIVRG
ncbi:MAG: glycosyltransferase, partial [Bdellovibrionia bacterium]